MRKDEELYNIFNTEKLLNRKPTVLVSKTSGLAGIAYWINGHYRLTKENEVDKKDEVVVRLKEWVDNEYENDRQTAISSYELVEQIEKIAPGRFKEI
jgi:isopropylmalate/homocitrate/citramalate synthase